MVTSIPRSLLDRYGHLTSLIPPDVLAGLTDDELHGRLRRAQQHWEHANKADTASITKAGEDLRTILATPPPARKPSPPSALKAAGVTTKMLEEHGPLISGIPDEVLCKLDAGQVTERCEHAQKALAAGNQYEAARILGLPAGVLSRAPTSHAVAEAMRRGVREDIARKVDGRWIDRVPDEVLAKLDAAELLDRCVQADGLYDRLRRGPSDLAHGYMQRIRQLMKAAPRNEVDVEVERLEKASLATDDPVLRQGYQQQASAFRAENPEALALPHPGMSGKAVAPPRPVTVPFLAKSSETRPPAKHSESQHLADGLDELGAVLRSLGNVRRRGVLTKTDAARDADLADARRRLNKVRAVFDPPAWAE